MIVQCLYFVIDQVLKSVRLDCVAVFTTGMQITMWLREFSLDEICIACYYPLYSNSTEFVLQNTPHFEVFARQGKAQL